MLANAATGSSKNIVPNRLMARSKPSSGKRCTCASPCSKATLWTLSARASSRARSIIEAERSTPSAPFPRPTARRPASSGRFHSRCPGPGRLPVCCTCGEGPRRAAGVRRRSRRGRLGVPKADPARGPAWIARRARLLAVVRVHRTRSYDSRVRRLRRPLTRTPLAGLGQGGHCRVKVLVVIVSGQHLDRIREPYSAVVDMVAWRTRG